MQRILVALDASSRAAFVLGTAADLAKRVGAKLTLLRTVGLPPEVDQEVLVHSAESVIDSMTGRAKKELEALAASAPPGVVDAFDVRIGVPWSAICEHAKDVNADLVVLGSHGYSGIDRVLGTTAAKVVNHCDRSVFVVRKPAT